MDYKNFIFFITQLYNSMTKGNPTFSTYTDSDGQKCMKYQDYLDIGYVSTDSKTKLIIDNCYISKPMIFDINGGADISLNTSSGAKLIFNGYSKTPVNLTLISDSDTEGYESIDIESLIITDGEDVVLSSSSTLTSLLSIKDIYIYGGSIDFSSLTSLADKVNIHVSPTVSLSSVVKGLTSSQYNIIKDIELTVDFSDDDSTNIEKLVKDNKKLRNLLIYQTIDEEAKKDPDNETIQILTINKMNKNDEQLKKLKESYGLTDKEFKKIIELIK